MSKYRFKTQEEFINQYGNEWDTCVKNGWNIPEMNYLFGKPYPHEVNPRYLIQKSVDRLNISIDMLTILAPNYNPKKLSYD